MLLFHKVMTTVYKPGTLLPFWDFRTCHSTYPEIQGLWLVKNWQQHLVWDMGCFGWMISKLFELIIRRLKLQIIVLLNQPMPKW